MNPRNRDLLVLTKKELMNQKELEYEIGLLNDLFSLIESSDAFCIANEVIDINRYKVIRKIHQVRQILRMTRLKPFVFICNKN